jgi:peptide/nickel transport system permease protein
MTRYVLRQLASKLLTIVLTTMVVFAIFGFGPQSPASVLCHANGHCTPQREQLIEQSLGLNQPIVVQYAEWVKGLFVGRTISVGPGAQYPCPAPCLGISYVTFQPVTQELAQRYPATISVAVGAAVVELAVGLLFGAAAARRRGSTLDRSLVSGSLAVSAIPYYVLCLVAWLYLVNEWNVFPSTGYYPLTSDPLKWFAGMLLPWLVLGLAGSATYARFGRGAMVESLGEDYIRFATAKGVGANTVVFKHAMRATLPPIATIFGLDFAGLLAGTYFTEFIFGINGVGLYTLQAIKSLDYPVIAAAVLTSAILVVVANLVVDLLYAVLDPRVRLT